MRTLGILTSVLIRCWQRPPVPMQPTLIVSLAPRTLMAGAANAVAAAEDFRKERRVSWRRGFMAESSRCREGSHFGFAAQRAHLGGQTLDGLFRLFGPFAPGWDDTA